MRDAIIIFIAIILAILIGGYLFLNGTPKIANPTAPGVDSGKSFVVLASGQQSGSVTQRKNFRITNVDDMAALWSMVYGPSGQAVPQVDFAKYEVLAIFDGTHSTSGYDVQVTGVADKDGQRVVSISHIEPGSSCQTQTGITGPFVLVRVSKTALPVTHEETDATQECP